MKEATWKKRPLVWGFLLAFWVAVTVLLALYSGSAHKAGRRDLADGIYLLVLFSWLAGLITGVMISIRCVQAAVRYGKLPNVPIIRVLLSLLAALGAILLPLILSLFVFLVGLGQIGISTR